MGQLKDERLDRECNAAFERGQQFGQKHPYSEFAGDPDGVHMIYVAMSEGIYVEPFDCFKYGAQAAWREKGEL